MRIAFLIDSASVGGGGEYVRKLARGLADSCESRVFYAARGECGAAVVDDWQPDVIHVNHLRALLQLFKFPWKRPAAPVVFTVHGIHLRKYGFLPRTLKNQLVRHARLSLERCLYRKCAALIALTESDREEIHRLYGRNRNVVVIPNGIAADEPSHLSPSQGLAEFAFICIGRFDFQKGQDILLRTIARSADILRARNRRTLFIGDGGTLDEMKGLADRLGILDLVEFAGEIPNAANCLSRGRILIAPSRWEGLPFLLLEAGLRKKAVIASDCPGNRDIITDGVSGILFPVEDVSALAALLVRDFDDDEVVRLGAVLESRVRNDFSLDHMLSATASLYATIAAGAIRLRK